MLHHMLRAAAQRAFSVLDPYFQYVTMLLHGDGTNGAQNNTFLDSSTNNFTITRNGNTTQGTFTPYGSNWSNYFDGSGDYLTASTTAGDFGSSAFTMEAWVFFNSVSGTQVIGSTYQSSSVGWSFGKSNSTGCFYVGLSGDGNDINGTTTVVAGTWYHIAVSGTPGATGIKLFVNGVQEGSTYTGAVSLSATVPVYVGDLSALGYVVNGYISNFRLVKGTAVYTSNFTPSTTPLTAISGTSLLTCQSNRFVDVSTNAYTITKTGDVSVQRFSPFSPTTAYSTSVIGGSGYFDGSGDSLGLSTQAAVPTGTQEFTFEFWVYKTGAWSSANKYIVNDTGSGGFQIWVNTGAGVVRLGRYGIAPVLDYSYSSLPTNAWVHFAYSRKGNNFALWVNGTRVATATDSNGFASSNGVQTIGGDGTSDTWDGYLANIRVVKGSYVYDTASTTITVPTAPLSAVSGTSLLLNFTNAGILDNAMMNDLETVGNAQISTSVKKYGTGSMYFDGSGDYLVPSAPSSNVTLGLGSGDFTVEFWVYFIGGLGSDIVLFDGRPLSTNGAYPTIYVNSSSQVSYVVSSADRITSASAFSTSTWYHIAVARSGTSTKMFVNGTQVGSTYTDSTNYLSASRRPVIAINGFNETAAPLNGYIDDLRITKGVARYTTTFTPPTAAFPNN